MVYNTSPWIIIIDMYFPNYILGTLLYNHPGLMDTLSQLVLWSRETNVTWKLLPWAHAQHFYTHFLKLCKLCSIILGLEHAFLVVPVSKTPRALVSWPNDLTHLGVISLGQVCWAAPLWLPFFFYFSHDSTSHTLMNVFLPFSLAKFCRSGMKSNSFIQIYYLSS